MATINGPLEAGLLNVQISILNLTADYT